MMDDIFKVLTVTTTGSYAWTYSGAHMTTREELENEIARIDQEINAQKKVIKRNLGKPLVIETAEAEMRALHTRLSVLKSNLSKI